jgi:1-deoxy-D-xylulose-5-phosphate reductoisomerase
MQDYLMPRRKIIILGTTGSIGKNTIDMVREKRDYFEIVGISAHRNETLLLEFAEEFNIENLAISGKAPTSDKIAYTGEEGLCRMIEETEADIVINGIAGARGFIPSIHSLLSGKNLALANKETLIMAGSLVKEIAQRTGRSIIPVDSEHSAIFQLFNRFKREEVKEIILTASGGAFRDLPKEQLPYVTVDDALKHPNWSMGKKITIDSASMANKGLEVIEANQLFDFELKKIKVVLHPQSIIHSMIKTHDGSVYAQLSKPDMRIAIMNALAYPDIISASFNGIDFTSTDLSFRELDNDKFPMLPIAFQAAELGGAYPLVYNAANEFAVEAFIQSAISFVEIPEVVKSTLEYEWPKKLESVEQVLKLDSKARKLTKSHLLKIAKGA